MKKKKEKERKENWLQITPKITRPEANKLNRKKTRTRIAVSAGSITIPDRRGGGGGGLWWRGAVGGPEEGKARWTPPRTHEQKRPKNNIGRRGGDGSRETRFYTHSSRRGPHSPPLLSAAVAPTLSSRAHMAVASGGRWAPRASIPEPRRPPRFPPRERCLLAP